MRFHGIFPWHKHKMRDCTDYMTKVIKGGETTSIHQKDGSVVNVFSGEQLCVPWVCQQSLGCGDINASNIEQVEDPIKHLNTFDEYYSEGGVDLKYSASNYLKNIKIWLDLIDRSQLFIVHFDAVSRNTSDTMSRLAKFLGLSHDWGQDAQLPHSNPSNVEVSISCETFDAMLDYYRVANDGLKDFINKNHAPAEPDFPGFQYNRDICYDSKSGNDGA